MKLKKFIKKHLILDGFILAGIGLIFMSIFQDNIFDYVGFFLFLGGLSWVVIIMLIGIIKGGKFFGIFQPIFENRGH